MSTCLNSDETLHSLYPYYPEQLESIHCSLYALQVEVNSSSSGDNRTSGLTQTDTLVTGSSQENFPLRELDLTSDLIGSVNIPIGLKLKAQSVNGLMMTTVWGSRGQRSSALARPFLPLSSPLSSYQLRHSVNSFLGSGE
ncbi:unnamed protein product [Pleuronectes platessa]|uniref:Uncharacterized protein n=1 Tax=Pleuronectes platessa TaxID=8262 RepID=A0A9N7YCG0_PLEPL|nr:unnamed protein product [Pleuronectes platessa]